MFTKEEEKKLRAEFVETYEYQKTSAAIQYYRDDYNSAPILDMADVTDAFEAGADWYKKLVENADKLIIEKLVENKGELIEPNVGVEWIDAKKRLPLPYEQDKYLIAVKNKNKENGIWLYDIAFWNSEEFERSRTWEDILYWAKINQPKEK